MLNPVPRSKALVGLPQESGDAAHEGARQKEQEEGHLYHFERKHACLGNMTLGQQRLTSPAGDEASTVALPPPPLPPGSETPGGNGCPPCPSPLTHCSWQESLVHSAVGSFVAAGERRQMRLLSLSYGNGNCFYTINRVSNLRSILWIGIYCYGTCI